MVLATVCTIKYTKIDRFSWTPSSAKFHQIRF